MEAEAEAAAAEREVMGEDGVNENGRGPEFRVAGAESEEADGGFVVAIGGDV